MLTHYPNKMMGKKKWCPICKGEGWVPRIRDEYGLSCCGTVMWSEPCPRCHGMSSQSIEHKQETTK